MATSFSTLRRASRLVQLDEIAPLTVDSLRRATRRTGERHVVVLVPAHDEAKTIDLALNSLADQARLPDLVLVIADNCTDGTEDTVSARGDALVVASVANRDKKAGALNQVLDRILPALTLSDAILVMDADSVLDANFIGAALDRLGDTGRRGRRRLEIGGVGGTFRGGRGGGFVGMLQRNEYARYARDIRRLQGRVLVLTGTAAVFTVGALRDVINGRTTGRLPGTRSQVYGTGVLTEDNELTLALLHLGYSILSPKECLLETEVMTTWRNLWKQRVRWKRGALENLFDYGLTRITARYWARQLLTHVGVLVTAVYLCTIAATLALHGAIHLQPFWLGITVIFVIERVLTVNKRGWLQMALASVLVIEMAFDIFLQAAQVRAIWDTIARAERDW
jgi:cellulose synthase/poly-beta-1,6-N-acetylglucosamine synthase-like glycosyltransferase